MCTIICGEKDCRINYPLVHNKKIIFVGMFCDEIYEYVAYVRLIRSLDNKNSKLYRTLLSAIRKLEEEKKTT